MALQIACCHNNYLKEIENPETHDRLFLKVIYEEIPRVAYQGTTTILRSFTRTTMPKNPFCDKCIDEIMDSYVYVGSSIREAELLIDSMGDRYNKVADEIEQQRNNITSELRERELGRVFDVNVDVQRYNEIRCTNPQELEEVLSEALTRAPFGEEYVGYTPSHILTAEMPNADDSRLLEEDEHVEYPPSPNPIADEVLDVDEYVEYALMPNDNPAARWAVDELERVDMMVNGDEVAKEDNCVVCLRGLFNKEEKVVRMPCKHEFHENCIIEWLSSRNVCPLCRFQLPPL